MAVDAVDRAVAADQVAARGGVIEACGRKRPLAVALAAAGSERVCVSVVGAVAANAPLAGSGQWTLIGMTPRAGDFFVCSTKREVADVMNGGEWPPGGRRVTPRAGGSKFSFVESGLTVAAAAFFRGRGECGRVVTRRAGLVCVRTVERKSGAFMAEGVLAGFTMTAFAPSAELAFVGIVVGVAPDAIDGRWFERAVRMTACAVRALVKPQQREAVVDKALRFPRAAGVAARAQRPERAFVQDVGVAGGAAFFGDAAPDVVIVAERAGNLGVFTVEREGPVEAACVGHFTRAAAHVAVETLPVAKLSLMHLGVLVTALASDRLGVEAFPVRGVLPAVTTSARNLGVLARKRKARLRGVGEDDARKIGRRMAGVAALAKAREACPVR